MRGGEDVSRTGMREREREKLCVCMESRKQNKMENDAKRYPYDRIMIREQLLNNHGVHVDVVVVVVVVVLVVVMVES